MQTRIMEWRQKRAKLIADARALWEKAEQEKRDLSQEEQNVWDTMMGEADTLRKQVEREERLLAAEGEMGARGAADSRRPETGNDGAGLEARRLEAFNRLLPAWVCNDYRQFRPEELRALQADLDVSGGYLRPPMQFIDQLIQTVDDATFIRQWATIFKVAAAESMGAPSLEFDPSDADWTREIGTGSEDSSMAFGRRELHPKPLAKRIKISRKLMMSVPSAMALVRDRLAYKFGITFEKACLLGGGANGPMGLFTAHASGISTTRDYSTGNTPTAVTFDGLIGAKYFLKDPYHARARWLFHRDGVTQIAKLKDANGQYLWRESVRAGEPDRLLGLPVHMSEFAPNVFAAGLYTGMLADFSHYWIADAMTLEFQLLNELYAETNQVGLIGRLESDGMPVTEEAFVRIKLG